MNHWGTLAASLQTASGLQDALAKCMSPGICGTCQVCLETWLEEFLSLLTCFILLLIIIILFLIAA